MVPANTPVPFNIASTFNTGAPNDITNAGGVFTIGASAGGIYDVYVALTATGSDMFTVQKNGVNIPNAILSGSPANSSAPLEMLIQVAAGDTIRVVPTNMTNMASSLGNVAVILFLKVA